METCETSPATQDGGDRNPRFLKQYLFAALDTVLSAHPLKWSQTQSRLALETQRGRTRAAEGKRSSPTESVLVGRHGTDLVIRGGGAVPMKSPTTIAVAALFVAILALAALETWIEHAAQQGQREVAAGVKRGEPGPPLGADARPIP